MARHGEANSDMRAADGPSERNYLCLLRVPESLALLTS